MVGLNSMKREKNFEIKLIGREKVVTDDGEVKVIYHFLISIDGNTFETYVDSESLNSFKWVEKATYGLAYYTEKKIKEENFYCYLHEVLERDLPNTPLILGFEKNGWKNIEGKWNYVEGNGVVGSRRKDIHGNRELQLRIYEDINLPECCQKVMEMENIMSNKHYSRFLLIFTCQSVLGTLFQEVGYPIRFITAIVGTTNTLKTSSARAFTQFYNAGMRKPDDVTFQSTKGGIETFLSKYRDAVLLVDDFMPPDSEMEKREMTEKLKMLVRAYGDGVCKSRMAFDPTERRKQNHVNGSCIITAEILPGIKSSQSRIIELKLQKGDVNKEVLSKYQDNPFWLSTFLWHFINWVSQNSEKIMSIMEKMIPFWRKKGQLSLPRYNQAVAQMRVTADFVFEFLSAVGFECTNMRGEWESSIMQVFRENDAKFTETNYTQTIVEALLEGIERTGGSKGLNDITKMSAKTVFEDNTFYYVTRNDLQVFYQEYCQRYNQPSYLKGDDLAYKLEEAGLLETTKDYRGCIERARKLAQNKGNYKRYLYIKKGALMQVLEKNLISKTAINIESSI